ncbi:hypothetical protein Tco_0456376 [Tanacetum coccineum]
MQGGLIRDHAIRLEELSPALFERYDRDIRELFIRLGAVREEIFSQRYRFRSLEYEQERVAFTEERHARLELTEVVDGMRRGQEPKGVKSAVLPMCDALLLVARDRADTHFLIRMWRVMWLVCSARDAKDALDCVLDCTVKDLDTIMSDSEHSTVTYTSVSEDDLYMGSPGVEVPIYEVPPSPDYIPGPEGPPSPDYVPGPEEPEQALHQGIYRKSDWKEDLEEDDEEDP